MDMKYDIGMVELYESKGMTPADAISVIHKISKYGHQNEIKRFDRQIRLCPTVFPLVGQFVGQFLFVGQKLV